MKCPMSFVDYVIEKDNKKIYRIFIPKVKEKPPFEVLKSFVANNFNINQNKIIKIRFEKSNSAFLDTIYVITKKE